jgi:hypothetical protein
VCLPIAPYILLSAQVYLATVTHAQQQIASPCVKVFTRFSENVLYFYRPHSTSVVGANFCGCIFFYPCSEKIIKNSEKIKKFDSYWCLFEKSGKNQEKEKTVLFACSVRSFHRPLFSPCCATSRHVLANRCDLYFGSGLNNR